MMSELDDDSWGFIVISTAYDPDPAADRKKWSIAKRAATQLRACLGPGRQAHGLQRCDVYSCPTRALR